MHTTFGGAIAGALITIALSILPASAQTIDFANPAFVPVSGPTSIPIGHAEFCQTHSSECRKNANLVMAEALTEARWQQLVDVNNSLNAEIVPETDEDLYKVAEFWTYPQGRGDCEDIALAKRRQLIADGWDVSTLLMTVVREASGEGHAVLMVRTDRGDLVLDNQDNRVLLWTDTAYQYIKRQSQDDAGKWVGLTDNHMMIVADKG